MRVREYFTGYVSICILFLIYSPFYIAEIVSNITDQMDKFRKLINKGGDKR